MTTMVQQVNLLIDDLQPRRVVLSARQGLIGVALVASLLLGVSLFGLLDVSRSAEQRTVLTQQIAVLADANLDPVLVPRFLKSLGSAPQFVGHPFDTFELAVADSGALRFTITGPDAVAP
ncbi:MAG: hypothetical protein NT024_04045 [Proteobacteria bacterium]|nr:hypothetical protein [Pseudomonadota bacterium]